MLSLKKSFLAFALVLLTYGPARLHACGPWDVCVVDIIFTCPYLCDYVWYETNYYTEECGFPQGVCVVIACEAWNLDLDWGLCYLCRFNVVDYCQGLYA